VDSSQADALRSEFVSIPDLDKRLEFKWTPIDSWLVSEPLVSYSEQSVRP
jgi:hypothetical protein